MTNTQKTVEFPELRGLLASKGLTQKDLCNLLFEKKGLKISTSALSLKLKGERAFKRNEMQLISEVLEESPVYLFFNNEYTKRVPERIAL
ncbi:hypothetical protein ACOMCU_25435 [Lysinibacillus sp. UGB7]|uniref:hypothetical protein n=1 Tax=Lysinibacillus sp. UGB7 TaxID=3411039 RepID=UPI003B77D7D1